MRHSIASFFSRSTGLALCAVLSLSLSSCASLFGGDKTKQEPVKTVSNTKYRTPTPRGPVPRNPDLNLPSNFNTTELTHTKGRPDQNYIAITFDDGPHATLTPRLLDMLRARNIKATFYLVGQNAQLYPNIVRRTVAEGHEVGNHSWSHKLLTKLSDDQLREDMTKTQNAIAAAAGVRPRTMRPPYGALTQHQRSLVYQEFGYPTILWSVDPLDWKRPGTGAVQARILAGTGNGAIILAHDIHAGTVDAMPATIDALLRRGYKFVTVSQLLAMKGAGNPAAPAPGQ